MDNASTDPVVQRYQKLREIRELGHDPYTHSYQRTHEVEELVRLFSAMSAKELDAAHVHVKTAGRLMSRRGHGKVGFGHVAGQGARIQMYVRKDRIGEVNYQLFKLLDVGDIIGVEGHIFRTKTGELTIFADHVDILTKSLLPLPEKWHGLTDVEARFRQRYLDLIANPGVREVFVRRSKIIRELRGFLEEKGFLEVETPMMHSVAGGATAKPFETFHEALGIPLYLRIAPELHLKRLTVGGLDRIYEINRNFRNEGISTQHNPEFTMLEFYMAYSDYRDLMNFSEEMFGHVARKVTGSVKVEFGEHVLDFGNFQKHTMCEAILHYWPSSKKPNENQLQDRESLAALLEGLGGTAHPNKEWGHLLEELFELVAESKLIQPTFIYDYPVELSPLSKTRKSDPRFVERFELYIGGFEVANAYSELNDPEEQEDRFEEQAVQRQKGEQEAHVMDMDYVRALRYGMPPTGGEGVGIDRLTMLLTNRQSIREVIFFPQLRPEESWQEEEQKSPSVPQDD
jgi:lysyl-tRNA synthetase class 2